jgi:putative SOS response-associated peptidase YedK
VWKVDQDHDRVYAFCTTEPNPLVAPRHPKAMPVILLREDHERWLAGSFDEVLALQAGYPSQMMVGRCGRAVRLGEVVPVTVIPERPACDRVQAAKAVAASGE